MYVWLYVCSTRITFTNQFAIHFDAAVGFGPVLLKFYRFHQWLKKTHKYRHIIQPSASILKGAESNYLRFNLIICFLFVWIVNNQTIRTFPLCIFAFENLTEYLVRDLIRCKWALALPNFLSAYPIRQFCRQLYGYVYILNDFTTFKGISLLFKLHYSVCVAL